MNTDALKDLLYRMADDALIYGHRSSEWTGIGPVLEEDIAFASMAQDEIGHAQAYYQLLEALGEGNPDQLAFGREEKSMRCCAFVEQPIGDYAFSLIRHFLFDYADKVRLEALVHSSYAPLKALASKIIREQKYHTLHASVWIKQLGASGGEANLRLQTALNEAYPMAFGIFEPTEYNYILAEAKVMPTEEELCSRWIATIKPILDQAQLKLPESIDTQSYYGGRKGYHSEYLQPLLDEMNFVFRIDPVARW